MRPVLNAILLS